MAADKKKSNGTSVFGKTSLDVEALRQIVEIVEASEVTQLIWRNGDEKLIVRRGNPITQVVHSSHQPAPTSVHVVSPPHQPAAEAPRPSAAHRPTAPATPAPEKKGHLITSPFVGTFYRNPSPDQPPFAEVGATVRKGQTLCIIEAMKLMNEIESEVAGKVAEILAENAQPVEFGQPLFRIEPA
ncbi:MAG: acetyl-CoA carboxylase biotin carboxyl carrier protein [Archangiaceae bacterium]|nr:acetyl-CoA carboxylase biotin carboxyl carrier protein [Archangiaceae bacterium]